MPAALRATTRGSSFASTRWTVVYQAADSRTSSQHTLAALSELCQIYWRPVYLFLRRQGIAQHDAQDLTQSFFAELIADRIYARTDQMKERFRSFLLGTLKHFLAHARDHDRAQKRGGGSVPVQLDEATISEAEARPRSCRLEWGAGRTPQPWMTRRGPFTCRTTRTAPSRFLRSKTKHSRRQRLRTLHVSA